MPDAGLVLIGMPGSGKSTVGSLVAKALGRPFLDTDTLVEERAGAPVAELLRRRGEPAFRRMESEAVAAACAEPGSVIAVGGGSIVDPLNRWMLWHHGAVGWLDVAPDQLAARLRADATERPTLQPYEPGRLAATASERAPAYRAATWQIDAAGRPASVASLVLEQLGSGRRTGRLLDLEVRRHHPIGPETARIVLGSDLTAADFQDVLGERRPAMVVDRRLVTRQAGMLAHIGADRCLSMPGGERVKRMRHLEGVLEWLATVEVERDTPLVALGGGTIGDVAGTAAALYARGLPLVHVPTSWLAQADSAIGGKVAVDLAHAKNAVGAFWPPVAVISDTAAMRTLTPAQRRDGIAESVKAALIGDPPLWELIERRGSAALHADEAARYAIVERSARLKLAVCDRDPFEVNERRTLNLGHTIGHALEVASGYRLGHGAAVALGLRGVAAIAQERGADPTLSGRIDALLVDLGFTLRVPFDGEKARAALRGDKKRRAGRQRWILPMEVGRVVEVDDVTEAEVGLALGAISPEAA